MLTNDELQLMADAQPLGPSWIRDALLELREHRARIAAHAAAYPERLSENELGLLRMSGDDLLSNAPLTHGRLVKAIAEIQQRRAADLTPEVLDALRNLRNWRGISQIDVAAIDAVLRAHGVNPRP